jgi:CHAP domain.
MTYPEFRNKWLGQRVDYDHVYQYQCVDLILQGLYEMYGIGSGVWGNAADYWDKPTAALLTKFDKVSGTPQQGDILIFKRSATNGNAGHIAWANSNVEMLEQNGGTGSGTGLPAYGDQIRIRNIPTANLLGILRPKGNTMEPVNKGDVDNYYWNLLGRDPDPGAYGYVGQSHKAVIYAIISSPEYKARIKDFEDWKAAGMELTKERDTRLYPYVSAVSGALNVSNDANIQPTIDAINKLKSSTGGISAEDSAAIKETNGIVKSILSKITSIFK